MFDDQSPTSGRTMSVSGKVNGGGTRRPRVTLWVLRVDQHTRKPWPFPDVPDRLTNQMASAESATAEDDATHRARNRKDRLRISEVGFDPETERAARLRMDCHIHSLCLHAQSPSYPRRASRLTGGPSVHGRWQT
jgi:hypothetical protein